ncbi:MAG: aromatic ring-hydroxylating dioxygenase subunit alpha [Pseudomonadota bacterium]
MRLLPETPTQLLPREAYLSQDWFDREQRDLFGRTWAFAGTVHDLPEVGDFRTVQAGPYDLIVLRDANGDLRGFHNICRHRGTELVEDCGNLGRSIVCPYHNWVYNLDGALRGVPAQSDCFPNLDKTQNGLHPAAVGVFRDLVFVNPEAQPDEPFDVWVDRLDTVCWPHDLGPGGLVEPSGEFVYEMRCNWKVFGENAVDGYHLAYLHKNTLGGPTHDKNVYEAFGRHLVWWSTERNGVKHRVPQFVENADKAWPSNRAHDAQLTGYGGVYLLFPTTILTPNPWGFSVSVIEPVSPEVTLLRVRNWAPKGLMSYKVGPKDAPGYDPDSGLIKSANWTIHPLETGDFQTEDVWVCEKMQRALSSPRYKAAHLAKGAGGEASLAYFQRCVLDFVGDNMAMAAE